MDRKITEIMPDKKNKFIPITHSDEIIHKQNNCGICGEPLQFNYLISYIKNSVVESGTCNSCGIRFEPDRFGLN